MEDRRLGNNRRTATMTSQLTPTPTRPIRVMLVPSAVSPPSAKSSAWTISTTVMTSTAVHGPTRVAASAPPRRCPLVPHRPGS